MQNRRGFQLVRFPPPPLPNPQYKLTLLPRQSPDVNLKSYNPTALVAAANLLTSLPPALNQSVFILEGYPKHAVQQIPEESSAFPDRSRPLLLSIFLKYPQGRPELSTLAKEYGVKFQKTLSEDGKIHSYVNYAAGTESLEELYGYEAWRVAKLRWLKEQYDPHGRFNYYLPITEKKCPTFRDEL